MTGPLYPPFFPPAHPVVPVVRVPEQLTANGVPLNSPWCRVESMQSLVVAPGRRGANAVVAGRHGVIRQPVKPYNAVDVVIPLTVFGVNQQSGSPTGNVEARLHQNIDDLLRLLRSDTIELVYTRRDGTARVALVEAALDPIVAVRERSVPPVARVSVALTLLDAFWSDADEVAQTVTGTTGTAVTLSAFTGSTAPVADARITFYGPVSNPRVAIGSRWVQFNGVIAAGRELVLECEHWSASSGAGAPWSPSVTQVYREPGPAWFEIPPSTAPQQITFTHTGGGSASVEIAGRRKYLTI